jgi:hypothetical protein
MRTLRPILAGHIVIIHMVKTNKNLNKTKNKLKCNNMKRRNRIIIVFATAAVTFGILWFTLGAENFNRGYRHHNEHWEHHHHSDSHGDLDTNSDE